MMVTPMFYERKEKTKHDYSLNQHIHSRRFMNIFNSFCVLHNPPHMVTLHIDSTI